jgi:hypothetical protein
MRHSLTIVLALTGVVWAVVYARSDVDSKSGQVIGNMRIKTAKRSMDTPPIEDCEVGQPRSARLL